MTSLVTDEHVPSVFVTTLRSKGHDVRRAIEELGEGTDDRELLGYCAENGVTLPTHDKKDFAGETEATVDHNGIVWLDQWREGWIPVDRDDGTEPESRRRCSCRSRRSLRLSHRKR